MRTSASMLALTVTAALLLPSTAFAYVGPGAGLSLLGALWALVAALGTALIFVVVWPVRRLLRRRHAAAATRGARPGPGGAGTAASVEADSVDRRP